MTLPRMIKIGAALVGRMDTGYINLLDVYLEWLNSQYTLSKHRKSNSCNVCRRSDGTVVKMGRSEIRLSHRVMHVCVILSVPARFMKTCKLVDE